MSVLKDVASLLIDIHGQHDNQTLLHRKNHLTLLDLYGKEQTDPLKEKNGFLLSGMEGSM